MAAWTGQGDGPGKARKITLLLLLVLALATVFILPRYVTSPWFGEPAAPAAVQRDQAAAVSPSVAAEKTRYRQESQTVLAEVVASRDALVERQVGTWAEDAFEQALRTVQKGDELYAYGDYRAALRHYRQARDALTELERLGQEKLETALSEGVAAIEALQVERAAGAADLASRIAPRDSRVQVLVERAQALPALSARMEEADQARADGRLEAARTAYEEALSLDPRHEAAAEALAATGAAIREERFNRHMSRGFAALDGGEFDRAQEAFELAAGVFPDRAAVQRALAQVDNERRRSSVGERLRKATELERQEKWREAVAVYESLLAEDPTLTDVKVRLIPARTRAELDRRIREIFEDPLRLADSAHYRAARQTLADVRGIATPGARLEEQAARLEALLQRAVSPVEVVFESDNQTFVTLFRVAELGRFEKTTLELRPGRYVAAGTRSGFRDVRVEFTVTGAGRDDPVVVRCREPI